MTKIRVGQATARQLDWLAAKLGAPRADQLFCDPDIRIGRMLDVHYPKGDENGNPTGPFYVATHSTSGARGCGPTAHQAALRVWILDCIGDVAEVPKELVP